MFIAYVHSLSVMSYVFPRLSIFQTLKSSISLTKFIGGIKISKSLNVSSPVSPESIERQWRAFDSIKQVTSIISSDSKTLLKVLEDGYSQIPECDSSPPKSSLSLFPSFNLLPLMVKQNPILSISFLLPIQTNLESNDIDFMSSSPDLSFYPRRFESLLTPVSLVKKTIILSTLLPTRLSRVYHIASASKEQQLFNDNKRHPLMSISSLVDQVWYLMLIDNTVAQITLPYTSDIVADISML